MIVTTTQSIEGYKITGYYGIVFGEVITGINIFKDFGAGIRNIVGGRSQGYEDELLSARTEALQESSSALPRWVPMLLLVLIWTTKYSDKATCLWLPHQAPQLP